MRLRLHSLFLRAIRREGSATRVSQELVGCSLSQLIRHLESKFLPGMAWDNRHQWHVDHIKPLCAFDLTDPEQQALAFHYSNLQPLWAVDNMRKGRRWQPEGTEK
jgi:Uri superfamily endonuclease